MKKEGETVQNSEAKEIKKDAGKKVVAAAMGVPQTPKIQSW